MNIDKFYPDEGYLITDGGVRVEEGDEVIVDTISKTKSTFSTTPEMMAANKEKAKVVINEITYGRGGKRCMRTYDELSPGTYIWRIEDMKLPEDRRYNQTVCKLKVNPL